MLAGWLGASVLLAAVVAPAAFAVLPSRTLAGALVGRVLPVLFIAGIVVGLVGLALDRSTDGRLPRVRRVALVVAAVACAAAQFGVAPRIERVRGDIAGPVEELSADDPRRATFGKLHAESVALLGLAMIAAASVMVLISMSPRRTARVSAPADPLVAVQH
jgi:hypothetical protein